jgi:cation transport ATPase
LEVGDRRARGVRRVLAFSILYNVATVGICLAGLMNPLAAAILMPISAVVSVSLVARS